MGAARGPDPRRDPDGAAASEAADAPAVPLPEQATARDEDVSAAEQANPADVSADAPEEGSGDTPEDIPPPPPPLPVEAPLVEQIPAGTPLEIATVANLASPPAIADPPDSSRDHAGAVTAVTPAAPPAEGDFLDEIILPSAIQAPVPLPEGTTLGPDDIVRIEQLLDTRGRLNRYSASVRQADGSVVSVELREAPDDHPDLRREAEILADVRYAMLPQLLVTFDQDGRRYLAIDRHEGGGTLAEALESGIDPDRAISIALQLAQVLRRLHDAGWALLGLQPAHITLGAPLRIAHLGTASRIGQVPERALSVAGYSAPEAAHPAVVTGREDVYTLGALLYQALSGATVPEQGPELAALVAPVRLAGAPQLLDAALAPAEERADLETFYRQLLAFKERRSGRALQLEFAGGTTVGLNPTRPVNEDAYVCTAWTIAHHDRAAYRVLLCVVDGMGGMEAGEVASTAAVRAVVEGVQGGMGLAGPPPDPVALVQAAARAVHEAAQGRAVGATITCAVVDDGIMTLAHVGDTRAYLLRDGTLSQLTQDHSLVAAMVASGVLTREEARGHPDSNKVLRSLGGQRELADEYIDTLATTRGDAALRLREGDRLLFCSDGVWGMVDDDALRELLLGSDDCTAIVQAALQRSLDGGAPDNATLIVARCTRLPSH